MFLARCIEANREEHHDYKKARNAELAGRSAEPAKAAARAINDSAMDRFNSRNGVVAQARIQKGRGQRVRGSGWPMARSPESSTWTRTCGSRGYAPKTDGTLPCGTKICAGLPNQSLYQLLGGVPRGGCLRPRLRPGSTLGLGLGAFLVSFLPLSLLPMKPNITRTNLQRRCYGCRQKINARSLTAIRF